MLHIDFGHWEVLWIASCKPRTYGHGRRCDQTVSLAERDSSAGEVPTPAPGALTLDSTEGRQMEPSQEAQDERFVLDVCTPQHLVHVDRAYPRYLADVQRLLYAPSGGALAQCVDQDGGVEQ